MSGPSQPAVLRQWIADPLPSEVVAVLDRLRAADDVCTIAVMPDCHLAADVCNGCVVATSRLIYPDAVGGDIGCGMAAVGFGCDDAVLRDETAAARVVAGLYEVVPFNRRHRASPLPRELEAVTLSHASLEARKRRDGRIQFGTLGRGNHFVEFQGDEQGRLWLMVHSGSRALGQAIRRHHVSPQRPGRRLVALPADASCGEAYLQDARWACEYARQSRRMIVNAVCNLMRERLGVREIEDSFIDCDHNHVRLEEHDGRPLWVHRKGAMQAAEGQAGVIPGSMGTESFHVVGRGHEAALCSSSHGAGRAMSRERARREISVSRLQQSMQGIWFDKRKAWAMLEESPEAYKDVRAVMRAQKDLTRIVRVLHPILSYKGV